MIKFKTFVACLEGDTKEYQCKCFEKKVNNFLDNHKVKNVKTNFDADGDWFNGRSQVLQYIIEYEEE